jgi:hypothetical protein
MELDNAAWVNPETGFSHIQEFYELRGRLEIELYRGDGCLARTRWRSHLESIGTSLLMKVQTLRAEFCWLNGRCALAELTAVPLRAHRREVSRAVRSLVAEQVGYATVWSNLLLAGLRVQAGDRDGSASALRAAIVLADEQCLHLCRAVANRSLGELLGGAAGQRLIEQANSWMMEQGIARPDDMLRVIAPGFESRVLGD